MRLLVKKVEKDVLIFYFSAGKSKIIIRIWVIILLQYQS